MLRSGPAGVGHCLAPKTLFEKPPKTARTTVGGPLPFGVTAKDVILAIIGRIGTAGGTGHVIEYAGEVIRGLSMEGRMTICNMSIEAGARGGMIAPDQTTFDYLKGLRFAPQGAAWDEAVAAWSRLKTDEGATFDRELVIPAIELTPYVTWGTNPGQVIPINAEIPSADSAAGEADRRGIERALEYMGLKPGTPMEEVTINRAFLGSCTNSRIEDLRAAATVVAAPAATPPGCCPSTSAWTPAPPSSRPRRRTSTRPGSGRRPRTRSRAASGRA